MARKTESSRYSGRRYIYAASAAFLSLLVAGVGVAGASSTHRSAARASNTLTVGIYDEPDTLDPEVTGNRASYSIDRQVFDTLIVRSDKTKAFMPSLATSWSFTPDGRTYTFNLRKGVTFQDGTPFNAAAVVFNLNRGVNPKTKSQTAANILGPYKSSKAVGQYQVKVTFKSTSSPVSVLDALSQAYWGIVSPAAVQKEGADFGRHPVGTGPFAFQEWVPNDHITLVKNASYKWGSPAYGHTGPAYLDSIVFRIIPDSTTRAAALQTGSIDLDLQLEPTDVKNLSSQKGISISRGVAPGFPVCIWMNVAAGPLADVKVRQAILYAFDRKTMLASVYGGQYAPAYGPLSPVSWSYDTALNHMYQYNVAKAASILNADGWKVGPGGIRVKNGKKLTIRFFDGGDSRRGEYLQANLKKVGINLVVRIVAFPELFAVTRKASTYDMASTWFASSDPSVLSVLFLSSNIANGYAISRWNSRQLDALLNKGQTTVSATKRAAIYRQIQLSVMKNAVLIPMYSETELDGLRAPFTGYTLERGQYPLFYDVKS
jgi:peptide/nickel transport system substrate-binding protein